MMNSRASLLALLLVLAATAGGCASTQTRHYDVTVRNESTRAITVWLTKDGPPYEAGWKSPEDLAVESRGVNEDIAGAVVPPGKTVSTKPMAGHFAPGVNALLRVYLGQWSFSELLAIGRGSSDRKDILLHPGYNEIVVRDTDRGVRVEMVQPTNGAGSPGPGVPPSTGKAGG